VLDEASRGKVKHLCDQIAKEQDRDRFSVLVAELNRILEAADTRAGDAEPQQPASTSPSS
jgi:hypothetical protein